MTVFAVCITVAIASICAAVIALAWAAVNAPTSTYDEQPAVEPHWTLDDVASHRPDSPDEHAWTVEYLAWLAAERRKANAHPYDIDADGGI